MTLDGKIATKSGKSKWITGEKSREYVHRLRSRYSAILCGIGTVLSDDPMLNGRLKKTDGSPVGKNPLRVIFDSKLRIPLESKIVKSAKKIPTLLVCTKKAFLQKKEALTAAGAEVLELSESKEGGIDFCELLKVLGSRGIDSLFIEGGAEINFSALKAGIVNRMYVFLAPKIFGGNAKSPVSGSGIESPEEAFNFKLASVTQFEGDILLEYEKLN